MRLKASAMALLLGAAVATPAAAQSWDWGRPAAGFAAGAAIGGALAAPGWGWGPRYYSPGYAYEPDVYAYEPGFGAGSDVTIIEQGPSSRGASVAYCMQRFKSYDPSSGTYLGYDGVRHPCP